MFAISFVVLFIVLFMLSNYYIECMSMHQIHFLYARHLTDVLWYGAVRLSVRPSVRPSVRSVVHNPCGQDIARTI